MIILLRKSEMVGDPWNTERKTKSAMEVEHGLHFSFLFFANGMIANEINQNKKWKKLMGMFGKWEIMLGH